MLTFSSIISLMEIAFKENQVQRSWPLELCSTGLPYTVYHSIPKWSAKAFALAWTNSLNWRPLGLGLWSITFWPMTYNHEPAETSWVLFFYFFLT